MMNIGEFAALTGLSVKALRHYDDRNVLAPADVDPATGYRRYAEDQVRTGVVLKTLRDAGVPVADATAGISTPMDALRAHRDRALRARQDEDRAHERAHALLASLAQPVAVTERARPAQPYVAAVLAVPAGDPAANEEPAGDEATDEEVNRATSRLWQRLSADGVQPTGPLWIAMRMRGKDTVDLVCCLPTPHRLPAEWGGDGVEVGELPARTDLCAVWKPAPDEDIPEGVTHPAVIGLLDAWAEHAEVHDLTAAPEVRQTATGTSPEDWTVEIAVTVGEPS